MRYLRYPRYLRYLLFAVTAGFAAHAEAAPLAGVYEGGGCTGAAQLPVYRAWAGKSPSFVIDFAPYDSWSDLYYSASWAISCWKAANMSVVLSVPMLPAGAGYSLADGAAGAYDSQFRQLAQLLVNTGHGGMVIRLGWEFNGNWFPWSANQDPQSWVAYYRRIVTVMRTVPGASKLRFDWCFSLGQQYLKPDSVYPGDAYVDYIGADVYNQSWNYPASDAKDRWNQFVTEPYGLQWQAAFAQQHGKPISFPEWATGTRPDGHGGGDDPYFVQQMSAWIASHNVYYHSYWDYDAPDFAGALSTGEQPQSAAQFLAIYH